MDEQKIIERIRAGEVNAFEELYAKYKKRAIQMAYLIAGNASIAMDITQEAFVQCYISLNNLREPAYFGTWFYKILTRVAWKYIKQEKKHMATDKIEEWIKEDEYSQNPYIQSNLSSFMMSQLNKMDYKKRTTLILYYYNELSIKEIAQVMRCCTGTVKSRLNSGRSELKKYLIQQQYTGNVEEEKHGEMVAGYR